MEIETTYYWKGGHHATNPDAAELGRLLERFGPPRWVAVLNVTKGERYVYKADSLSYDPQEPPSLDG